MFDYSFSVLMLLVGSFVKGKEYPYRKPVSDMTYNVFGGTLNPAQQPTVGAG